MVVDFLLQEKLGDLAWAVVRYLRRPGLTRNPMPVVKTARAIKIGFFTPSSYLSHTPRAEVSPAVTAIVATAYLQDLIAAGSMAPEMSFLACDPNKLARARKAAMESSREKDKDKYKTEKIVGMGYDGRRDKHTRSHGCRQQWQTGNKDGD